MEILTLVSLCIIAYVLGSINFARVLSKRFRNDDIVKHGSGNPGANNMLRTYGFPLAFATLIIDMLKGLVPTFAAFLIYQYAFFTPGDLIIIYSWIVGICAVIGHILPVFYRFRGGKGVSCAFGVFLAMQPLNMLFIVVSGFILLLICDRMSVVSLYGVTAYTLIYDIYYGIIGKTNPFIFILPALITIIIFITHRKNIVQLFKGTERKVNFKQYLKK